MDTEVMDGKTFEVILNLGPVPASSFVHPFHGHQATTNIINIIVAVRFKFVKRMTLGFILSITVKCKIVDSSHCSLGATHHSCVPYLFSKDSVLRTFAEENIIAYARNTFARPLIRMCHSQGWG